MNITQGQAAFITGGASGIGFGIAGAFIDAGMNAVLADLRADHIDQALAAFAKRGQSMQVHAIRLDVTDRAATAAAAAKSERVFGKPHMLVNNAGVGIQGPFSGISYDDWDFGLAVNLGGVINGLQTFLPRIRAHGEGGHIVNTASLAGADCRHAGETGSRASRNDRRASDSVIGLILGVGYEEIERRWIGQGRAVRGLVGGDSHQDPSHRHLELLAGERGRDGVDLIDLVGNVPR